MTCLYLSTCCFISSSYMLKVGKFLVPLTVSHGVIASSCFILQRDKKYPLHFSLYCFAFLFFFSFIFLVSASSGPTFHIGFSLLWILKCCLYFFQFSFYIQWSGIVSWELLLCPSFFPALCCFWIHVKLLSKNAESDNCSFTCNILNPLPCNFFNLWKISPF